MLFLVKCSHDVICIYKLLKIYLHFFRVLFKLTVARANFFQALKAIFEGAGGPDDNFVLNGYLTYRNLQNKYTILLNGGRGLGGPVPRLVLP